MKKLLTIVLAIVITLTLCACVKTDTDIANYADDIDKYHAGSFMPSLETMGEYQEVNYFIRKDESLFPHYSMQLVVKYDEVTFLEEKERLGSAYSYLDGPRKSEWGDTSYTIPIEEFSDAGFDFKIAIFEDTDYPKNFGMVGISDEKQEIAYLWTYAPDLDYICETNENEIKAMNEFIEEYFALK